MSCVDNFLIASLLLLLSASSSTSVPCPPHLRDQCECSDTTMARYRCTAAGSRFDLKARFNELAEIICLSNSTLTPAELPSFPVSNNRTLEELVVTSCSLAGAVSDVLRALGAAGAKRVIVRQARGPVGTELVGLEGVKILQLDDNLLQTSLPWEVFAGLPSLEDVRVMRANLNLLPGAWPVNTQLRSLQLLTAGVARVPAGAFSSLPRLEELTISNSALDSLDEDSFRGLVNLHTLYLNRNPLRALGGGALRGLRGLRALHAHAAHLRAVGARALEGLDRLQEVSIEHGEETLTLGPGALSGLPALQTVSLQGTSLAPLPADLLRASRALVKLTMAGCDLMELPSELLKDQRALMMLDLSGNRLRTLNPDQFWSLVQLRELDLSDNQLETLPDTIFAGLGSLLTVHLDANRLTTISTKTFSSANKLQTLTLNSNNLSFQEFMETSQGGLVGSPLAYLLKLRTLELRNNSVAAIFDDWRISWLQIERIDLSWNKITELKAINTAFATNVTVDLRHNQITSVEPWTDPQHLTDQATFLLSDNPFLCDCSLYPFLHTQHQQQHRYKIEDATCMLPAELKNEYLQTLPMTSLTCSVNEICPMNCQCLTRPADSTLELDCLKAPLLSEYPDAETRVKGNIIKSLLKLRNAPGVVTLPNHVYSLDLSDLNLQYVPFLPETLTEVDLRNNQIKNIPTWLSQRNIFLHLPNNTLRCDCSTQHELKQLNKYKVHDFEEIFCDDGRQLAKIDVDALCNVFYASIIGGTFAGIGLVSITASVLIYRNAKAIQKFIYAKGWSIFIIEEKIDGKMFDVLVSYPDELEQYVYERFVPLLEAMGYSVSVRYRDWYIGDWIPDKVAELVQDSRRIVVLLSNTYPSSMARLELENARKCELRDRRERVSFVAPKDLVPSEEVKTLLDKRKCLHLEDEGFLPNLRRWLPKRREKGYGRMSQKTMNMVQSSKDVINSPKKSLDR